MQLNEVFIFRFTSLTGQQPDFHTVIHGYHFIGLSASDNEEEAYSASQRDWLKEQLDKAVAESTDRPVFVIQHEPECNTVFGSSDFDGWGESHFGDIFEKYPQIIDLAGHTHYPLNDPRSIWQGAYTAIGTGSLYYADISVDRTLHFPLDPYNPKAEFDVSACWVIEINRQHDLRMRGLNILTGEWLCDFIIPNPADTRNRDFTPEKRAAASRAPVFPEKAALRRIPSEDDCTVVMTAPAAQSADGMPVFVYRITVTDKKDEFAQSFSLLSAYPTTSHQRQVTFRLRNLKDGAYRIELKAETAYGVSSRPLTADIVVNDRAYPEAELCLRSLFAT